MRYNGWLTTVAYPRARSNDRRRYRLALTTKGRKLYDKIAPTTNKRYNELMSAIDSDETDALVRALQKIIQGPNSSTRQGEALVPP